MAFHAPPFSVYLILRKQNINLPKPYFYYKQIGQNITKGPPMYKCIEMVLKGDVKAKFLQQIIFVGNCTVANFITVIATMIIRIFPTHAYCDQKQCK